MLYLSKKLHEGTVKSSNNVTNWVGTVWLTPILGAYIADAHLGRYWTFIISAIIYLGVLGVRRNQVIHLRPLGVVCMGKHLYSYLHNL